MISTRFNRWTIAAFTFAALAVPGSLSAQTPEHTGDNSAQFPSALPPDPKNNELLDRAFISSLADGDIDEAVKLADRILTLDKSNRVARLVVGGREIGR